jgi:8-oxo-dGTP diphosphatase
MIRVLASVIERDGRLLICRRPAHKRHGNLWEFPGGKLEEGESDFDAVSRELSEELAVIVRSVGEVHFSIADPGSSFQIEFLDVVIVGEPRCLEHEALEWVQPNNLLDYELAPSDRRYATFRLGRSEQA